MLPEGLLEDIKTLLGVEGDESDELVSEVIESGIEHIDGTTGMKLVYTETGRPRDMLFEYCQLTYISEFDADAFAEKYLDDILLIAVKNYLDITWHDIATDNKLSGIIARGIKHIDKIAGAAQDYTVEDKPRELLLDYCRYVRSNALNEFDSNYQHELLSLQIAQEVADYEASDV